MKQALSLAILYFFGLLVLFMDFVTKLWAYHYFQFPMLPTTIGTWKGIRLAFALVLNHGAAWGWLAKWQVPLLIFRMIVVAALIVYFLCKKLPGLAQAGLLLIIMGALGNILDFFLYGAVVDFISLCFWGYSFPVFNLADCWITCGALLLLLHTARKPA